MTHISNRLNLKMEKQVNSARFAAVPRIDRYFVRFVFGCSESYACSTVFIIKTNKAKITQEQATKVQRYNSILPLTLELNVGYSTPSPGRFTPGKEPVHIVRKVRWAPRTFWMGAENLATAPPAGFDHRTHQPVASRYTD